jgi:hypothetical protein
LPAEAPRAAREAAPKSSPTPAELAPPSQSVASAPAPTAPASSPNPTSAPEVPAVDEHGCVRDAKKHATEVALAKFRSQIADRLGREPTASDFDAPNCASSEPFGDVDGDGQDDDDISLCLTSGTLTWTHYLYFSNRGCPKAAGEISHGELHVLDSKSHGVKDLEATGSNGCAGLDFTWTRFGWDGKAYRRTDTATCELCTDDGRKPSPDKNRHPYCKRELARRKAAQ